MAPLILDGDTVARNRVPRLRTRAHAVLEARGTAPRLLLVAFEGPDGEAPWVSAKLRACAEAGVDVRTLILPGDVDPHDARTRFHDSVANARADGVFVQVPFPQDFDGEILSASIPPETDIDVMRPDGVQGFLSGRWLTPPLTVTATLTLLEAHNIRPSGHTAVVIGDPTPFNRMFRATLDRRGAGAAIVSRSAPDVTARLAEATLVVTSIVRPGAIRSRDLAPGAIVIDGGYFNPGGVGDVDLSYGSDHLKALAPVPGGIGPMTVSALIEAVVSGAEKESRRPR